MKWLGLLCLACGATSQEPCTQNDLAKIEADFQTEMAQYCAGRTICADENRIVKKYRAKRQKWVTCNGE